MDRSFIKTIVCALLMAAALSGCTRNDDGHTRQERVAVTMRGGINQVGSSTKGLGQIKGTLPPQQLDVNIITVNYSPGEEGPAIDQPKSVDWQGQTADVTRGYFGESSAYKSAFYGATIIPEAVRPSYAPDSGNIEYTDADGTSVQKVFYDEEGEHYFVRIFYPYENTIFTTTSSDTGAAIIFNGIDGGQDIMCSDLGWGNIYNPVIETANGNSGLVFFHKLSLFRLKIKAQNNIVVNGTSENPAIGTGQYGTILGARVKNQPNSFMVDAMNGNIIANSPYSYAYYAKDFGSSFTLEGNLDYPGNPRPGDPEFDATVHDAGYFMVMPGQTKYRIEVQTSERNWVYGDLIFTTPPQPGVVYDIEMTMMESYEIVVVPIAATEWWMDSIFN